MNQAVSAAVWISELTTLIRFLEAINAHLGCTGLPPLAPGELIQRGDGHSVRMPVDPKRFAAMGVEVVAAVIDLTLRAFFVSHRLCTRSTET